MTTKSQADLIKCLGCIERSNCYSNISCNEVFDAIKRLKAYEDTGLAPEEIMESKMLTGWIPVSERLPEELELVLTVGQFDDIQVAYWDNQKWYLAINRGVYNCDPVAWMPLPESYKPVK